MENMSSHNPNNTWYVMLVKLMQYEVQDLVHTIEFIIHKIEIDHERSKV